MQTIDELVWHFFWGERGPNRLTDEQFQWLIAEGLISPLFGLDGYEGEAWCEDCRSWKCWACAKGNCVDLSIFDEEQNYFQDAQWHLENMGRAGRIQVRRHGRSKRKRKQLTVQKAIESLHHRFVRWSRTGERLDRLCRLARLLGRKHDWKAATTFLLEQNAEDLARELLARWPYRSLKPLLNHVHDLDVAIGTLAKKWRGPVAASIRSIACKAPREHSLYRHEVIASVGKLSRVAKLLQQVRAIDLRRLNKHTLNQAAAR